MLTTIENIKAIRDISANLKDGRISPYIREVEDAYIMPTIGAELYQKLDEGTTTDAVLLDGGYFTNADGVVDYCHGIRVAVAYYAYVRVLQNNGVNVTAFGVVSKQNTLSSQAQDGKVDNAATEAKKMGDLYLQSIVRYINRSKTDCDKRFDRIPKLKMAVIK